MTNRLDLAAAAAGVDAALAHRLLSNLKRYPQLTASVRFAQSFSDREAILPGAELTLPIFDTGDAAVAKALAALDTAVATRDRVMQNIQSEVRSAMEAWSSLDTQLSRLEREELDLATSQLNRVRAHVNAGESDDSDQLRAKIAWRRVQRQAITLTHKTAVASIELRRAVGGSWETHATIDTLSQRSDTP
jgi:outer membrane protein TolC